ncbi:MAG: S16 family serine protease [Candidatus Micrarchaeota archaeon]
MRTLVILLLLLSFSFAACGGEVEMGLPAVSGGEGLLVNMVMKSVPGEGMEYVGAEPSVGTATQESLSTAADVARELAQGGYDCDLLLRVDEADSPGGVEGPSAGAAFAVMAYSLFTGEGMREDAAITGAISDGGLVLPVGGLYEKALSAKIAGMRHFVTPIQSVEEKLMLRAITGINIHEVEDAHEAVEFFLEDKVPPERPLELEVEPLGNLTPYEGARVPGMESIVRTLIGEERAVISGIEDNAVRGYFGGKAVQHEQLYGLGYDYAAANGAFLTQISASAIAEVSRPDIEAKKMEVQECLGALQKPAITIGNYEWLMGGEAREMRARRNYGKYSGLEPETKDEEYLLVYQMGYSKAWCDAAAAMYATGSAGGAAIDEAELEGIAEGLLNYTDDYGEWQEYADTGKQLYEEGMYAGAVYELMFARSMVEGDEALEEGVTGADYALLAENESASAWGMVFRAHSLYLMQQGENEDAYRMIVFARNMDGVAAEVGAVNATAAGSDTETGNRQLETENLCMPAFFLLVVAFVAVCEK